MRLLTAAEMRSWDARTIEGGTPGRVLMERAGRAVAARVRTLSAGRRGPVVVVCGPGNNGGDGFVVARVLRGQRRRVSVWLLGSTEAVRGDAAGMLARWRRGGGRVHLLDSNEAVAAFARDCRGAAVVVDALFGTGLRAALDGLAAGAVGAIDASGVPVLAVDVPSGLSADTGEALGAAVRATITVTFGAAKVGLCVFPGCEYAGRIEVADIGLDPLAAPPPPAIELLDARTVGALLPPRRATAHKGNFGHALVVAGSRGKLGAALLAAEGVARAGAGLTTLAVPESLQPIAEARVPEVMTAALADRGDGVVAAPADGALEALLLDRTTVVCGPGLGVGSGPRGVVERLLEHATVPMVLDADGLNAVAGTSLLTRRHGPVVVTPHPGEMSRLVARPTAEVQRDRIACARRFAAEHEVVVVLKGARTVVAAPDGRCAVSPAGNPGLASGGSGDVLAGVVGGLLAQGLAPFDAARLGVFAHGHAADRIAARRGHVGLLARDLLAELPPTLAELRGEAGG